MKFILTFKTPDVLDQIDEDVPREKRSQAKELAQTFVRWDEYIDVEFDTETGTATVLTQN